MSLFYDVMPAGVSDTGQLWPPSAKKHWFDLPENQINRHVSHSKKQNLKAQLDDWNLNAAISEPITASV